MLNFLGVTENFSVLAGTRWVCTFMFTDEVTGERADLDAVTFNGSVRVSDTEVYELGFTRSSGDEQAHIVEVTVPELPEGRWTYSIFAVSDSGDKERLMNGYVTAVGALEDTSGKTYSNRTLEVKLPNDATKRVQLEWQASTVAQLAAKNALAAAESMAGLKETAGEAVSKAQDALDKLGSVEGLVADAQSAASEAVGAADKAQELVDNAPREYVPTIVGGYWYVNGQPTGVKAVGADGHDGKDGTTTQVVVVKGTAEEEHETASGAAHDGICHYFVLAATRMSAGKLVAIRATAYEDSLTPLYLVVREQQGGGSFEIVGKSTNATALSAGHEVEWRFDGLEMTGVAISVCPVQDATLDWEKGNRLPLMFEETDDGSYIGYHNEIHKRAVNVKLVYEVEVHGGVEDLPERGESGTNYYVQDGDRYMVYQWTENDGWVCIGDANKDVSTIGAATSMTMGAVKLGTDMVLTDGAVVGTNEQGQMMVPMANAAMQGAVMLSTSEVIEEGAPIGCDSSGRLVADAADLSGRKATLQDFGVVRLGSEWMEMLRIPYAVGVGATKDGRLANNLLDKGALKHMQHQGWNEAGMSWTSDSSFLDEKSYYMGLHTSGSFTQSQENGLEMQPATQRMIGGVTLTRNALDDTEAHVLDASAVHANYATRPELDSMLAHYILTNSTLMAIKVMTQEEYDKLSSVNAHTLYLVY